MILALLTQELFQSKFETDLKLGITMFHCNFCILLVTIVGVAGVIQEITFYTDVDFGGASVTFRTAQPNFTGYEHIIRVSKSYCAIG